MLDVHDLTVSYGPIEAVREVSFRVEPGAVVSLVGPNGAGKTTTLNAVSGVIPARRGRILFQGRDITRMSPHQRVSEGIVQIPEGRLVLAGMTVRENLEMGAYRRPRQEIAASIDRMEARFPILRERSSALAGTLSGGEQQMLAIARGLMAKPKLLLLDEPSLGLAPLIVQLIFEIIRELQAGGQTILLVEQNARQALAVSSHAYVMENGKVVLEGPAAQPDDRSGRDQLLPRPSHFQLGLMRFARDRRWHVFEPFSLIRRLLLVIINSLVGFPKPPAADDNRLKQGLDESGGIHGHSHVLGRQIRRKAAPRFRGHPADQAGPEGLHRLLLRRAPAPRA